ncbi:MAG: hypothetical protein OIF36_04470 [Alphaproteobacteria bacterium]|jgi:hypothetical protein|nr:hypothetical protein [Alphaproteobacteria bacterium]MCV6599710.1 hypothetical protein [Alphaproteobacteria bacterium]
MDNNKLTESGDTKLFANGQEAWFWFMQANEAKIVGAKCSPGMGAVSRPCEPEDIMNIINKLYRQRTLLIDHVRILAHYGKKLCAPNKDRYREQKACTLWKEAMSKIEPILVNKGIIKGVFA